MTPPDAVVDLIIGAAVVRREGAQSWLRDVIIAE
jgi:hypothetical protein